MENGNYIIELAGHIPVRNINFYIDTCRAMSAVNVQMLTGGYGTALEVRRLKNLPASANLKAKPRSAIAAMIDHVQENFSTRLTASMKLDSVLSRLRGSEFIEKDARIANYPFHFLSFAIVEDLKLHGQGASYTFVEKVLDELAEHKIIHPELHGLHIKDRCATMQDMAALFLGYSLASRGALLPIVPFPARPAGFAARLASELSKLLPPGGAFLTLNRSRATGNDFPATNIFREATMLEAGLIYLVFKLMDRGLRADEIDSAMKKMIGPDWREVRVETWLGRFKDKKYLPEDFTELSVDVLEVLIMGRNRIDNGGS